MMYPQCVALLKKIRSILPHVKIIVGGPHATILPKECLENISEVDVVIVGEGEQTIVELMNSFEKDSGLNSVDGIFYRNKGIIQSTKPRNLIQDLDHIPIPDRTLLDMTLYRPSVSYYKKLPAYMILTSRGCPFQCTYCSKIFGSNYRHHSVGRVLKEMEILIKDFGAREIVFRDDTFTINKTFTKNLCESIIEKGYHKKISWSCMTRVNLVDFELLTLMKRAGCWGIHYGVESGSQRLLDIIKKGITIEQIKRAHKITRKVGSTR
jgi:anaerobic magnesium-protoporphyrin IX monomethyl ester cyclase